MTIHCFSLKFYTMMSLLTLEVLVVSATHSLLNWVLNLWAQTPQNSQTLKQFLCSSRQLFECVWPFCEIKIKNWNIKCWTISMSFRTLELCTNRAILRSIKIPFNVSLPTVCWTCFPESTKSFPWMYHGIDLLVLFWRTCL